MIRVAWGAVLAVGLLSQASAQSARTERLRVTVGPKTITLHGDTSVVGMKGKKVRFVAEVLQKGKLVAGVREVYSATPKFANSVWKNDKYSLDRAQVAAAVGPGLHSLQARISIEDATSGRLLGRNLASFRLRGKAGPKPLGYSATLSEVAADPGSTARDGTPRVRVTSRLQIKGLKGKPVVVTCQLVVRGRREAWGRLRKQVTPKFDSTLWKSFPFDYELGPLRERLGSGTHRVAVELSVRHPATKEIAKGAGSFELEGLTRATPPAPPPPQPQPPTVAADPQPAEADWSRLKEHPSSSSLALDPLLVGRWSSTPFVEFSVLEAYAAGEREDLSGLLRVFEYELRGAGQGVVRELPCTVEGTGAQRGVVRLQRGAVVDHPLKRWGVELRQPLGGELVALLRLEFEEGLERGGLEVRAAPRAFAFTYLDERSGSYIDQPLVFRPLEEQRALLQRASAAVARLLGPWLEARERASSKVSELPPGMRGRLEEALLGSAQ